VRALIAALDEPEQHPPAEELARWPLSSERSAGGDSARSASSDQRGLAEMFGSAAADGRWPEAGSARPRSVGDLDLARILQQREPSASAAPRARPASRGHEAAPDMAAEVEELRARVSEQQAQMGKLEAYQRCGDSNASANSEQMK
jgi:hypothetical protein